MAVAEVVVHQQDRDGSHRRCLVGVLGLEQLAFGTQDFGVLGDIADDLEATLDAEVAVDAREVLLDGLHAQPHAVSDGLVVEAGLEQRDDVALASREATTARARGFRDAGQPVQEPARHPLLAGHDAPDRQLELRQRLVLQVVPIDAGRKQAPHVHVVVVGADHEDLHLRVLVADPLDRGQRLERRHGDIDQQQVRL